MTNASDDGIEVPEEIMVHHPQQVPAEPIERNRPADCSRIRSGRPISARVAAAVRAQFGAMAALDQTSGKSSSMRDIGQPT